MKSNKGITIRRLGVVLTALVLCFSVLFGSQTAVTALAAETGSLDLDRKGSITVNLSSDDGKTVVSDGILSLYKAAELNLTDWDMSYVYTDEFSELGEVPEDLENSEYASVLAQCVLDNSLAGTEVEVDAEGIFTFDGLTAGLYLIIQTEASEGYYSIDPFVVTLPMDVNGTWEYDVDASPKTQIYPEESGSSQNLEEIPDEIIPDEVIVPDEQTDITESSTLPQTGQLYWPIPILALCGAALVGAGLLLRRKKTYAS